MESETLGSSTRGKHGTKRHPDRKRGQRVTIRETVDVLTLHARGISQSEIARITGLSVQQVNTKVLAYASTEATALQVLKANAHKAAEDWVRSFDFARKRGEHRPMKDALVAIGVIAPDPENQGITVLVGSGDVSISAGISSGLQLPSSEARVLGKNDSDTLDATVVSTLPIPNKAL